MSEEIGDKPPYFRKWSQVYALVLGFLIVVIVLLYWFSRAFV